MPSAQKVVDSGSPSVTPVEIGITAAAFLLRLLVMLAVLHAKPASWFYSQASELGELAHSVASGGGLSSPFGGSTGPSAFLPPGYPLLVGGLFNIFGSYSRRAEIAQLSLQACFGAISVLLMMILGGKTFGKSTATVTGLLLAIDPWIISLGFVFWDTSLSLSLFIGLVLVTVSWIKRPARSKAYCTAFLGALAIAVNASLALTVVCLFSWALYRRHDKLTNVILPGILFALLCSVWPIRNELVMKTFIPLRDNLGYELWQGNRPGGDGFFDTNLHPNTSHAELLKFQSLGELGYMREKSLEAKQFIAAHPGRFANLTVKRVTCFWLGISKQSYRNQIVVATITSLLGIWGLLVFARRRGLREAIPFLIPLAVFPIPYYITHPDFRFWCLLSPLLTSSAIYVFTRNSDSLPPQSR